MKPKLDELIAGVGDEPQMVTFERACELILAETLRHAGRAMAAVKLGKPLTSVTREELLAALDDWVTVGNEALTGKTLRAGENAVVDILQTHGIYDATFARLRISTNRSLDKNEVRVLAKPFPSNKRPSGRPGSSEDFAKWVTILVWFMIGSGEASSVERAITLLTGRDRQGNIVVAGPPRLALPRGKQSRWVVHDMLRRTAESDPDLIDDARGQGELAKAGVTLDEQFSKDLADIRAMLADPEKVKRALRAVKRANLTKTP